MNTRLKRGVWPVFLVMAWLFCGGCHHDADNGGSSAESPTRCIHPEAPEICGDGIDQNCDGSDSECDNQCAGDWYRANLTNYTSYPDPESEECVKYNGCTWAGRFYGLDEQQTEEWVAAHNIVAVHQKDWGWLGMKTIKLRQGSHDITANVYDLCSDSDCDGCCTENLGGDGYLIDIEHYTMERFGSGEGIVEFQVCQ